MQNYAASFAGAVSSLDELEPFYRLYTAAEDEYLPSGPPMSPLTNSYFSTWSLFDLRFGRDRETIGTCMLDTASILDLTPEMVEVLGVFKTRAWAYTSTVAE